MTLFGLLAVALSLFSGGRARRHTGVLECHGGFARLLLRATPVRAHAMTLGHVVLGCDADCLERTRAHERVHVRQTEQFGALFPFAYLACCAWALHVGDNFRTFIQFGNHVQAGKNNVSTVHVDRLDLQQGFVDVRLPIVPANDIDPILRAGRQEMVFGSQRLVAIRDAPNVRRSFDGLRLGDTIDDIRIDGFVTRPVLLKEGVFDDEPDHDQALWGAYSTVPVTLVPGLNADIYYLGFENDQARFGTVSGGEHRHSIGARLFGTTASWDWDWETLGQFGSFAGQDIGAWTLATNTGYTFRDTSWTPRVGLKADIASGDHDPRDGTLGTFNALFPKLAYFNEAALVAPANFFDVHPSLSVRPTGNLMLAVGWDFLWRETTNDAVYVAPLTPVAGTAGRSGRFIGHQASFDAVWETDRHVLVKVSYVHFEVGSALRTGGGRNVDFVMISAACMF